MKEKISDDIYLKLWAIDQVNSNKRWTITTFFLGISFAILGFSFQSEKTQLPIIAQHIAAIFSYWFAYLMSKSFNDFTNFIRSYIQDIEDSNKTSLKMQTKVREYMKSKKRRVSTTKLIVYFGIVYTVTIIATWFIL